MSLLSVSAPSLNISTSSTSLSPIPSSPLQERMGSPYGTHSRDGSNESISVRSGSFHGIPAAEREGEIKRIIFTAINDGDRDSLLELLANYPSSTDVLQILLTTSYPNMDGIYQLDEEVLPDAAELLGPSLTHLNAIQIACVLNEEDIALDILEFVARTTEEIESRKVLYEFMGRVWGNGNTVLHLASFQGMSDLVKRLLELGAASRKKNERNYMPVDCADDDVTREIFGNVVEDPALRRAINQDDGLFNSSSGDSLGRASKRISLERQSSMPLLLELQEEMRPGMHGKCLSVDEGMQILDELSETDPSSSSPATAGAPSPNSPKIDSASKPQIGSASLRSGNQLLEASRGMAGDRRISQTLPNLSSSDLMAPMSPRSRKPRKSSISKSKSDLDSGSRAKRKRVSFDPATLVLHLCQHAGAADPNYLATIRSFIARGVELNAEKPALNVNEIVTPQKGLTALHQACTHGHVDVVEMLLSETNSWVNTRDAEGWTPLHCACAEGHIEIVRLLGRCQGHSENGGKQPTGDKGSEGDEWVFSPPDGPINLVPMNGDGETPEQIALEEKADSILKIVADLKMRYPPQAIPSEYDGSEETDSMEEENASSEDEMTPVPKQALSVAQPITKTDVELPVKGSIGDAWESTAGRSIPEVLQRMHKAQSSGAELVKLRKSLPESIGVKEAEPARGIVETTSSAPEVTAESITAIPTVPANTTMTTAPEQPLSKDLSAKESLPVMPLKIQTPSNVAQSALNTKSSTPQTGLPEVDSNISESVSDKNAPEPEKSTLPTEEPCRKEEAAPAAKASMLPVPISPRGSKTFMEVALSPSTEAILSKVSAITESQEPKESVSPFVARNGAAEDIIPPDAAGTLVSDSNTTTTASVTPSKQQRRDSEPFTSPPVTPRAVRLENIQTTATTISAPPTSLTRSGSVLSPTRTLAVAAGLVSSLSPNSVHKTPTEHSNSGPPNYDSLTASNKPIIDPSPLQPSSLDGTSIPMPERPPGSILTVEISETTPSLSIPRHFVDETHSNNSSMSGSSINIGCGTSNATRSRIQRSRRPSVARSESTHIDLGFLLDSHHGTESADNLSGRSRSRGASVDYTHGAGRSPSALAVSTDELSSNARRMGDVGRMISPGGHASGESTSPVKLRPLFSSGQGSSGQASSSSTSSITSALNRLSPTPPSTTANPAHMMANLVRQGTQSMRRQGSARLTSSAVASAAASSQGREIARTPAPPTGGRNYFYGGSSTGSRGNPSNRSSPATSGSNTNISASSRISRPPIAHVTRNIAAQGKPIAPPTPEGGLAVRKGSVQERIRALEAVRQRQPI